MPLSILNIPVLLGGIFLLVFLLCFNAFSQEGSRVDSVIKKADTLLQKPYKQAHSKADTALSQFQSAYDDRKAQITNALSNVKHTFSAKSPYDTLRNSLFDMHSLGLQSLAGPVLTFGGGQVAYNFTYRSNTDTPYAEKNIYQHLINVNVDFSLMDRIPFSATVWIRRSNSKFYRDITDVQLRFNTIAFQQQLAARYKQKLALLESSLYDSSLEKQYAALKEELSKIEQWIKNPLSYQKLVQANEILKVPEKSLDISLPDSINRRRIDSLQQQAKQFIDHYHRTKVRYDSLSGKADSLAIAYTKMKSKLDRYKELLKRDVGSNDLNTLKRELNELGINPEIPSSLKWLMGIRNFSLGRAPVNYSELTAKDISLNGINFEYNSWYYLAVAAGLVDYRFNDVLVRRNKRTPQYFYMLRLGIGKVEKTHLIVSAYRGQKQVYFSGVPDAASRHVSVFGYSLEGKWKITPNTYAVAEVAESLSPNLRYNPEQKAGSAFNLSDKDNKAYSVKISSRFPATGTHLEAMYKYTGANFQSFSGFQTNATLSGWYVQAEQYVFDRRLKINASLRSNDFSNPYILQNYESNTIFKSVAATLRIRKLPVISLSYMPMSQLTMMEDVVVENRFQTLMATISHYYKVGSIKASSFGSLHKFYNNSNDTGFVFYNATNILVGQNFFFDDFTASINFSRSASAQYALNVASEEVSFPVFRRGSVGLGVKLNNYNRSTLKVGQFININYQVGRSDFISVNYERGYLPGTNGRALRLNDFGNVQFIKRFR